eukprot:TRINITY_DN912_c2_g1_i2.p1 TRINITY_DN912_c2_g1~~TRINITY_DN912_c2_g1_i2.p1  ORF type:complete len:321 (+),score=38.25 TRINITY_DN912_c2_g1_i2:52-1014(+)
MKYGGIIGAVFVMSAVGAVCYGFKEGGQVDFEEVRENFRGVKVPQIFQRHPEMKQFYTKFEAEWNVGPGLDFSKLYWEVPVGAVATYLFGLVVVGQVIMSYMKPFDLRIPLAAWNWFLAVFSLIGAVRTVPHLLSNLSNSFEGTICDSPDVTWGVGATGLWVQLFIFSKIPELVDTVFIVLRKKPLIFLHWYHHVTVLLYCWHAYATECGAGLYFVAMNYVVHAVMYAYFAFSTLRIVPKWFPPVIITAMQILQMFVGMFICGASIYFTYTRRETENPCHNNETNLMLASGMYFSYLLLFLHFAVRKYLTGAKKKVVKTE